MIPVPADQQGHRLRRGSRGGRPPAFDREAYKQRNTVERCINRLKQWRGNATRYEKTATVYLAGLHIPRAHDGALGKDGLMTRLPNFHCPSTRTYSSSYLTWERT